MLMEVGRVISQYRTKRKFFSLVAKNFGCSTPAYHLIKDAYDLAREEFYKIRRHDGSRYFYHKVAVAVILLAYLKLKDANLIAAALLHDLLEDIPGWTVEMLAQRFGHDVAHLVDAVTKPDPTPYGNHLHKYEKAVFAKVRNGGYRAIKLKLADRLHNMITLWGSHKKKHEKALETLRYVLPLAIEIKVLWKEIAFASTHVLSTLKLESA